MKAFAALVHREYIEHRGAFFIAPLVMVAIVFLLTLFAFSVDRINTRFSGQMLTVMPTWVFEAGFAALAAGWLIYLGFVLFFYCADGFAADKRNNAMLFWKSMPASDLKVLLSKLTAALTILPGSIFAVALLSIILMFGVAYVTTMIAGLGSAALLWSIVVIFGQMSLPALYGAGWGHGHGCRTLGHSAGAAAALDPIGARMGRDGRGHASLCHAHLGLSQLSLAIPGFVRLSRPHLGGAGNVRRHALHHGFPAKIRLVAGWHRRRLRPCRHLHSQRISPALRRQLSLPTPTC
jgi:hypothetical protein